MAKVKYPIEEIGQAVKVDGISDKDMSITLSVLKKVSDVMDVKTGTVEEQVSKAEALGIILSDEQRKVIEASFADYAKYPVDMRKSIGFWGKQANTMRNLLIAIKG